MDEKTQATFDAVNKDTQASWAWLELHPLVLGVLIGIVAGFIAATWIWR